MGEIVTFRRITMQKTGKILKIFCAALLVAGGVLLLRVSLFEENKRGSDRAMENKAAIFEKELKTVERENQPQASENAVGSVPKENLRLRSVKMDVPFTSQAPTGDWSNPLFQNGCEEASAIMAMSWVQGKSLTPEYAQGEILKISELEMRLFGFAIDSDVDDTARFMREYYGYADIETRKGITAQDIQQELLKGNLVLTPADGKVLNNPHYTPPGPDEHMLVVIGYDAAKEQFITNDPGTKFGASYRYPVDTFMAAVWNYPSGAAHTDFPGSAQAEKAMIVVKKNS